ncbi:cupin domain-containing protein [Phytohabitans sp. ZYX-F-186]|uniref:Cupin domain-containing protein n=1 Tax=Phytohabitans maris TaxID=3071409 RepID=A0ABU0ZYQ8_9ACTN|nr:cupin domain-containing protein [Phytohabitans sp. ZYX-F-186]MDQ7911315.1 cupin domain-containing protein [Phytohabitans sp. ZYX-F-186]
MNDLEQLETAWEREPFVSTDLGDFDDVFSVGLAQQLIYGSLPLASLRMFRAGKELPSDLVARSRAHCGRSRQRLVDGDAVARYVGDGATLVLEELQIYSPEVANFAAAIHDETGYDVECTAFLTPRDAYGVAPHYDTDSVLVRQVYGSKRWSVRRPVRQWPSEWDLEVVETEPVLDVVLHPGDCLYIPRGFVHAGVTTDEASAHLSVGLHDATWGAALCGLLAEAAKEVEPLREAVPPRFAAVDHAALFRQRRDALAARLAVLEWGDVDLDRVRTPVTAPAVPVQPKLAAALGREP